MGAIFFLFIGFLIGRNWNSIKEFIGEIILYLEKEVKD